VNVAVVYAQVLWIYIYMKAKLETQTAERCRLLVACHMPHVSLYVFETEIKDFTKHCTVNVRLGVEEQTT